MIKPIRVALPILITLASTFIITSMIARADRASIPLLSSTPLPQRPIWGEDSRANGDKSGRAQQEPSLAISRRDADVIVVAAKDFRATEDITREVWIYTSHNGGRTWPWNRRFPKVSDNIFRHSDPVVVARDDGRIYVASLASGDEPTKENHGLFITWSDNDGVTWHDAVTVTAQQETVFDDKEWLAIDQSGRSPYYHRMYIAWRPAGFRELWSTFSVDGGLTWADPIPAVEGELQSAFLVIDSNGRVLLFYIEPLKHDALGVIRFVTSDDGGETWSEPEFVAAIRQPKSPLNDYDRFRVFSIISVAIDPDRPDYMYVVWTDARDVETNGSDVMLTYSHDGGERWNRAQRLSTEPEGRVRDDFLPVIHVGARGRVHAFWMDRRGDPDNMLVNAVYRASDDGGVTWGPTSFVSDLATDHNIAVPPISPSPGDYWGLDSVGNRVCVAWSDTREGDENIYVDCGWMSDFGFQYYLPVRLHN